MKVLPDPVWRCPNCGETDPDCFDVECGECGKLICSSCARWEDVMDYGAKGKVLCPECWIEVSHE